MIDFAGLPFPKDAPPSGACARLERDGEQRLARIVIDPPHRKLAVFDGPLLRDLDLAIDGLEGLLAKEPGAVEGLVIAGREPLVFCAGADVDALAALDDARQALRLARIGQELFQRLHRLSRGGGGPLRTVAAVGGAVPGGAYELCLALDAIVLADDPASRIGLPEVRLGILPGWGGCQRLPRRVGAPKALAAILSGKLYGARDARRLGLVDRTTWPTYLARVAANLALGREPLPARPPAWKHWLIEKNPLVRELVRRRTQAQVARQTGGHYPAPLEALELVLDALSTPLERGLEREAEALARLAVSPVSKALVSIFQASERAKKLGQEPGGGRAANFERVAVVGAGVMGAGIASLCAEKGLPTRLTDMAQSALDRAVAEHRGRITRRQRRRRLSPHGADGAIDRLETTTSELGFGRCDLVVEAVAERLEVKRKVLATFAERVREGAVLATNTSSLSVDAIAAELPAPERVVGLHFFNPVDRMPLVEVVRGARTSPEVVRRAARLALDLGKTPVVVADRPGFAVNRLLGPYLDEALRLFEEGASPKDLDQRARAFGLPMGPFELLDQVGLDVAAHAARSLSEAYGERMQSSALLAPLVEAGELGVKTGRGIYLHEGREKRLNPRLERPAGAPAASELWGPEQLDRLLLPLVNEAARCLEEGVVEGPAELDLAAVFGMGFPPFRGGPLRWADARGAGDVLAALERCAAQPAVAARPGGPARFAPAPLLASLAASGGRFHG